MPRKQILPVTLWVSVGDSQVMNKIGTADLRVEVEKPFCRQENDAPDATQRILDVDLVALLERFAKILRDRDAT